MSAGVHPIVPAVSTVNITVERPNMPQSHSPTKSTASELNPDAPSFQPNPAYRTIHTIAQGLSPSTSPHLNPLTKEAANNMDDTRSNNFAEVESSDPSLENDLVQEGVHFSPGNNIFIMTCDTLTMPDFGQSKKVAANIVASYGMPSNIQLNILTGPRLPLIHRVQEWFNETLGPFIHASYRIQIVIVRCGEKIGAKWTMTDLDLENFHPLTNFVAEIMKALPAHAQIIWGATSLHELKFREYYHSKAAQAILIAFENHKDKGVRAYSESIDSGILNRIAQQNTHLKGRKSVQQKFPAPNPTDLMGQMYGAYPTGRFIRSSMISSGSAAYNGSKGASMYSRSGTSSQCGTFDPNATPFKPQCVPLCGTSQQISSLSYNEPFRKQLIEVDTSRGSDWIPPVREFGPNYDQPAATQNYYQTNNHRPLQPPQMSLHQRSDNWMNIETPMHSAITSQPNYETPQRFYHKSVIPGPLHAANEQQSQSYSKKSKKKFNNRGCGGYKHPHDRGAVNYYDQGLGPQFNGYGDNGPHTVGWNQQVNCNGLYQENNNNFKENSYDLPNWNQHGEAMSSYVGNSLNSNRNSYGADGWNQNGQNIYNNITHGNGGKKKNKKHKKKGVWDKESLASEPQTAKIYFSEYTAADHIAATTATSNAPSQTTIPAVSIPTGMLSLHTHRSPIPIPINTAPQNLSGAASSAPRSPLTIDGFGAPPTSQNMGWNEPFATPTKDIVNQTPTSDSWTKVSLLTDTPILLDALSPALTPAYHDSVNHSSTFKANENGYESPDQTTSIGYATAANSSTQEEDYRSEQEQQPNVVR